MDEDWIISQLLYNPSTRKRLLDFEEFEHIKNGKIFTDLPLDVIALILSYCPLKNVLSYMVLCKRCYEAITTRKHFWNRHIQEKLKNNSVPQNYIALYDTFIIKETLREQYEWLFRLGWCKAEQSGKNYIILRKDFKNMVYVMGIFECKVKYIEYYKSSRFNWVDDLCEVFSFDPENTFFVKYAKYLHGKPQEAEFIFKDGSTWKGGMSEEKVPNGKGEWKFKDLIVAREAVNGKPIYDMTPEEYYNMTKII